MPLGSRRKKSIKKFLNLHFLSYTNIMHLIRKLRTSEVRSARLQWQKLHARPPEMQPNALNLSPTTVSWWKLSLANDAWGWDTMDICLHLWHPSMVSWWALLSRFQTTRDATKCSQITLHKSIPVSLVQPLCSGLLLQQAGCHWPMMHETEIQWSGERQLSIKGSMAGVSRFHARSPEMQPKALDLSPTTVCWFTSTAGWLSLANDAWGWDTMVEGVPIVHWSYSSHAKAHVFLLTLPKPVHIISNNNYSKTSISCLRKAMKSNSLLGPFCGSEFWGLSLLKI